MEEASSLLHSSHCLNSCSWGGSSCKGFQCKVSFAIHKEDIGLCPGLYPRGRQEVLSETSEHTEQRLEEDPASSGAPAHISQEVLVCVCGRGGLCVQRAVGDAGWDRVGQCRGSGGQQPEEQHGSGEERRGGCTLAYLVLNLQFEEVECPSKQGL